MLVGDDNWNRACDISDPNGNVIDYNDLAVFTANWLAGTEQYFILNEIICGQSAKYKVIIAKGGQACYSRFYLIGCY